MTLTQSWAPLFTARVRSRGRTYQREGRVRQLDPQDDEVLRAHVNGSEQYTVAVRRDNGDLRAHCTCAHFSGGHYCKHLWAALLDAQEQGLLSEDADVETDDSSPPPLPKARKREPAERQQRGQPEWMDRLALLWPLSARLPTPLLPAAPAVMYVVRPRQSNRHNRIVVELMQQQPTQRGWGKPKPLKISEEVIGELPEPVDREIAGLLLGGQVIRDDEVGGTGGWNRRHNTFMLPRNAQRSLLQRMIETGHAYLPSRDTDGDDSNLAPLSTEAGEPWMLWLRGELGDDELQLHLELRRGGKRVAIDVPSVVAGGPSGVIVLNNVVHPFDDAGAHAWVAQFSEQMDKYGHARPIRVPLKDVDGFVERLYMMPALPELDLPDTLVRPQRHVTPRSRLALYSDPADAGKQRQGVNGEISFDYDGREVGPSDRSRFIVPPGTSETSEREEAEPVIRRDHAAERQALSRLAALGFRTASAESTDLVLASGLVPEAAQTLIGEGWIVHADRKLLRPPSLPQLSVHSGIDWFELHGGVRYESEAGEQVIALPEILKAAREGRDMIQLDDGSQGMLPTEWLAEHGLLTGVAEVEGDHLKFRASQAALLDAMLDERELVQVDERFAAVRERLREFAGIAPTESTDRFRGELRPYQREGLAWLEFLQWFGMGGILADDMGLGKTIQVLALFDRWYHPEVGAESGEDRPHRPALVIAPKSVVYNWVDEARRFTPELRVVAYSGTERHALRDQLDEFDVLVTSYGLLRRDAVELAECEFDYVVLDEAQAIKNPSSQGAKAARLLRTRHRLALTGTPVENHIGDLWSIFEFLNPGFLGATAKFQDLIRGGQRNARNVELAQQVGQVLRPFILRRTKQQVLADLPEKTEQTIACEMEPPQRKIYDELRQHYRSSLMNKIGRRGIGGNAMAVLEALLRLRQAACHPALIDQKRADAPSTKSDTLMEQVDEIIDEGAKALVFSQFTSMLALIRQRLDSRGITYEYLDGQTRNRKQRVERFQTDPDCPLFLISLKAGGLGLNLTAAEYVFILDPWWNPAVEQQAIDRAHRIGQTRPVFAYRLICQDTVEQRIIELQQRKQEIADAIVGGNENILRTLSREDLEHLLT